MAHIKDYLIGVRESLEKQYDRSFCSKCGGKGFIEYEVMGGSESDEWGVIDVKVAKCDDCF